MYKKELVVRYKTAGQPHHARNDLQAMVDEVGVERFLECIKEIALSREKMYSK